MNRSHCLKFSLTLLLLCLMAVATRAEEEVKQIPEKEITALQIELEEATKSTSSARQKLAIRRVIRSCEELLANNGKASNRFAILGVLFSSQQKLIGLDNSALNRRSFLETCRLLADAPNEYAAIRLDADLLLSQSQLAQQGADAKTRAAALPPLIDRYRNTEVESKVIRIAMLMALEFGDAGLTTYMRRMIAERCPGDMEMINFQRDKLAGQVFGAPFIGRFELSDGTPVCFPMDFMGKTTALYFWSKDNGGIEDLRELTEAWKKVKAEKNAADRYQFVSFNLDDLPDAGKSILNEMGVDWPAVRLPQGREHPIYKTYVRGDPFKLTMAPTGYTAMFMSGAGSSGRGTKSSSGYERTLQSSLARVWTLPIYTNRFQSILAGDFLVTESQTEFDASAPPEWQAVVANNPKQPERLKRTSGSLPEQKLKAIQACFIKPPQRYRLTTAEAQANYRMAEKLCKQAIAQHPKASDLWIVRNRRIVALLGLWKTEGKQTYFAEACKEANALKDQEFPMGTDIIANFCIARQQIKEAKEELPAIIERFANQNAASATANALASLLALEISDRQLHETYRRKSLDLHPETPAVWTATAFLLDRYYRYWMYQPPFVAGWTYGRRQGHFLATGAPEDAKRQFQIGLTTLDGEKLQLPKDSQGKWSIVEFRTEAETPPHVARYGTFTTERPIEDVEQYVVILDANVNDVKASHAKRIALQKEKKRPPDHFKTAVIEGGINHPAVQQLGIIADGVKPDLLIIRPDGSIAAFLSGLTMISQHGNALQNVIEWQDEKLVEMALSRGDLEEAKRLAYLHAPLPSENDTEQKKPPAQKISVPHLRARTKVSAAVGDLQSAKADVQEVYLEVNRLAGWLSMRTEELENTEELKSVIFAAAENSEPK